MNNNDIYKYFGECIDSLIKMANKKMNAAAEKIEKENESRDKLSGDINKINEVLEYDLTTNEGYCRYMEYLANIRKTAKEYNGILKIICGQTAEEILDSIAQKATDIYMEAQNNKQEAIKANNVDNCNSCKKSDEDSCKKSDEDANQNVKQCNCDNQHQQKYTINNEEELVDTYVFPSEKVDDDTYYHICNIVDRYFDEEINKYCETTGLEPDDSFDDVYNELIEFACWLNKAK